MRVMISHASTLSLLLSSALSFTPCPLLGPAFPPFTLDISDKTVAGALRELEQQFDELVATGTGTHGDVSPNSTFSIALFSADTKGANDLPFIWQYHHKAPALNWSSAGSQTVTDDSIYRIGGLTEAFTVWSLLLTEGDHILNDPVTKYLPELVDGTGEFEYAATGHVLWNDVTVGQLASHMSGVARDYCSKGVTFPKDPAKAGLPPSRAITKPCCGGYSTCDASTFLKYLANQASIVPAGVTPVYSNMAFQLLGYIVERRAGKPFSNVLQEDIFDVLGMTETSIFAPFNSDNRIIPVSEEASGWSARQKGDEASNSLFTSITDLSIAGRAILSSTLLPKPTTNRWLKPVTHTSNPANSLGLPWVIYSGGSYPITSMVDIYTLLSNENAEQNESLYSSYLGLVPDFGVGFAILSADTETPADLNAHADIIGDVMLSAFMEVAIVSAGRNFGGSYQASGNLNSSITVETDDLPGLFITEFISNGTDFRQTLSSLVGIGDPQDLSIRLYPTQLLDYTESKSGSNESTSGIASRQSFRAVFQDKTELADNGTPTCVSWMDLGKLQYRGRSLDEFIFALDSQGRAVSLEVPALRVQMERSNRN